MTKKIADAVQTSILLPREVVQAIKMEAIKKAFNEQREVHWTDLLRDALLERFKSE